VQQSTNLPPRKSRQLTGTKRHFFHNSPRRAWFTSPQFFSPPHNPPNDLRRELTISVQRSLYLTFITRFAASPDAVKHVNCGPLSLGGSKLTILQQSGSRC